MTNLMPAGPGSNEGSVSWSSVYAPGGAPTITNDSTYAADGTKSLKVVSAASGTVKIAAADVTVGPGVALSVSRDVGFASAGGIWVAAYFDYFNGGSYLTTHTDGANANTSAFDTLSWSTTTPASTTKLTPGFQIEFTGAGQIVYFDRITIDDGSGSSYIKGQMMPICQGF